MTSWMTSPHNWYEASAYTWRKSSEGRKKVHSLVELAASEEMQMLRRLKSRDGVPPDNAGSGVEPRMEVGQETGGTQGGPL